MVISETLCHCAALMGRGSGRCAPAYGAQCRRASMGRSRGTYSVARLSAAERVRWLG